jgi:cystinosin
VFACLVTLGQCVFFERGKQRVSHVARVIGCLLFVFLLISSIVSLSHHLSTLTLLYFYSYVKLTISIIKCCPQAWMNYRRKSTEGWSIGNILLDFTGGVLSILQMFLLASNYGDWSSIFGSPTKFGLGFFSVLIDVLFIVQHYILYRTHKPLPPAVVSTNGVTSEDDEQTPFVVHQA